MFFFPTNIVGAHMLTQSVNYLRGILNKCKKKLNSGVLEITLSFQDQLGIKNYRCAQSIIKEKSRHGEYKLEVSCQNIRIDQVAELGYKRGQAKKNNASSDTLLLRK